jgi:DNA-binding MarR family transcriptional regulator
MTAGKTPPDVDFLVALLERVIDRMRGEIAGRIDWGAKGNLRPWHLAILLILPPQGARPSALADRAAISRQAISQWIRELTADGYLVVARDSSDGRGRVVMPTPKALETIGDATRAITEVETAWRSELGGHRLEQMRDALRDLRDGGAERRAGAEG